MALDIDRGLQRLADQPAHPGLAGLESVVFARLASEIASGAALPASFIAIAAVLAASMGVAGAGMPGTAAQPAPMLSPFGPSTPLAPSTLLGGAR